MKSTFWTVTAAIAVVSVVGCSTGRDEAKRGVAEFRARVSQHAYSDVYANADAGLREAVTQEKFVELMAAIERKLGTWQSAADPVWNFTRGTNGHFVKLTYQSQFTRGPVVEEFVWRIQNTQSTLLAYHVNSPLLVSD